MSLKFYSPIIPGVGRLRRPAVGVALADTVFFDTKKGFFLTPKKVFLTLASKGFSLTPTSDGKSGASTTEGRSGQRKSLNKDSQIASVSFDTNIFF